MDKGFLLEMSPQEAYDMGYCDGNDYNGNDGNNNPFDPELQEELHDQYENGFDAGDFDL